jgi:DHA1 family tetracycline resistance protein-like MFS transporter
MAKAQSAKSATEKKALPVVLLTIFLDVLGVGILIPVLYPLIYKIFIPAGYSLDGALILLGWLTAIYPLMQFAATPVLGQLSDRYGRKPVLGFSLAGTALGYIIFAIGILTKNIPLLFLGRALDGVTGGNLSVARAVIADVTPRERLTQTFGLIGAMFGIGFVAGPYIGSRLSVPDVSFFGLFNTPSWFGSATPFWFCAILSVFNTVLLLAILPETHKHINKVAKIAWTKSLDNIKQAATAPGLRVVFTSMFLFTAGFTFFTTFFQGLLIDKLGFKPNNVGDFYAYIGIWISVAQAVLIPILAKKYKNYQLLRISFIGLGLALFAQLLASDTTQLLMVSPFIAIFNGMTFANATSLVSMSASAKNQGEVLGIDASVQALGQAIPAIISGYVATFGISAPVWVGGTTIIVGGIVFNLFYRHHNNVGAAENDVPIVVSH